jgi:hypothetical protein
MQHLTESSDPSWLAASPSKELSNLPCEKAGVMNAAETLLQRPGKARPRAATAYVTEVPSVWLTTLLGCQCPTLGKFAKRLFFN